MVNHADKAVTRHRPGLIVPEIAAKYGYADSYVSRHWLAHPHWPTSTSRRGRYKEFDGDLVDEFYRTHIARPQPTPRKHSGGPDDLLTQVEIAAYTGRAPGTIRSDISRGRLGPEDEIDEFGGKLWKRSTVDERMGSRRRYQRKDEATDE